MRYVVLCLAVVSGAAFVHPVAAWDGTSQETGASVTIEGGNLVRPGETIDVYDYEAGRYRTVDVEDVTDAGPSVEVEVYDPETDTTETLEMEN